MATPEDFQNALSAAASSQFNGTNFPTPPPEPSGPGAFGIPGVSGVPGSPGGPPRGRGFFAGLNDVLTKISQSQKQKNEEIAQQQKLLQLTDERKAQQQRIDLEHERLEQEAATRDLNLKAAAAVNQAHAQEMKMQATKIMSEIAARPTSETAALPGVTNLGGGPANSDTVDLNVPGLGVMHLPTDEARARIAAQREQALLAPQEAVKERETAASKKADLERMEQQRQLMTEQTRMIQEHEDKRSQEVIKAENLRNAATNATTLEHARITAGATDSATALPYVEQALNGDLTDQQLQKLPLPKGSKAAIVNGITQSGGVLLTKDEQDLTKAFTPIVSIVQNLDRANKIIKDNQFLSRVPTADAYKQLNLIKQEIEGVMPNVARVIATDTGRLSNQQINLVKGMTEPSTNFVTNNTETNQQRRDDFLKLTNQVIEGKLSRLPAAQKAIIKQKLGIDKLIPGVPQGTATQPSKLIWTPQGLVPAPAGGTQ